MLRHYKVEDTHFYLEGGGRRNIVLSTSCVCVISVIIILPQQKNKPRASSQQSTGSYRKRPRLTRQLRSLARTSKEVTVNQHLPPALPSATLNNSWPLQRSVSEAVLCHSTPKKESGFGLSTSHKKLDGLDHLELSLSTSASASSSLVRSDFDDSATSSKKSVIETDSPQRLNISCLPVNGSDLSSVDIIHHYTPPLRVNTRAKGRPLEHDIHQWLLECPSEEYTSNQNASIANKELQSQTPQENVLLPPRVPPRTSSAVPGNYSASDEQLLQEGKKLQFVLYKRTGAKQSKKTSLQSAIQQLFGRKSAPTSSAAAQMQGSKRKIMPAISRSQTSAALVSAALVSAAPPTQKGTHNWITSGKSLHSSSPNLCGNVSPSRLCTSLGINLSDEEVMTSVAIDDHIKFRISSCESINDEVSSTGTTSQTSPPTHNTKDQIDFSSQASNSSGFSFIFQCHSVDSMMTLSRDFSSESVVGLDKCNSSIFVHSPSFSNPRDATPVTRRANICEVILSNALQLNSECFPHSTVTTTEFSALHSTSLQLKSCTDDKEKD